ncbi:MAG: FkbM family methyltransferase [Actinomycetota bacterium]|nr:FkbM family methyltransferase [Actinomycetota bacterium]
MRTLQAARHLLSVAALGADRRQSVRIWLAGLLFAANWRTRRRGQRSVALVLEYRGVNFPCVVSELRDLQLLRHVFITEQYRLDDVLQPEVIVDAGSNIGLAALYFRIVYPGASILALEPDPIAFGRLQTNTRGWPGIVLRNVALAAVEGPRVFYRSAETWTSSLLPSESWTSTDDVTPIDQVAIQVHARTLSSLMAELDLDKIDLLKLDVEGAEWEVLPALDGPDRIGAIVGELHWDVDRAPPGRDLGGLLHGYEVVLHTVTRHRSEFCAVRPVVRPPGTSPRPG